MSASERTTCASCARLDKDAEKACVELAPMLKGLSRERVAWELLALLSLPDPVETVRRMHESGVLSVILPEAAGQATSALAALVRAEEQAGIAPSPIRRLAALLPAAPRLVEPVAARLRLSAAHKKRLVTAAERSATPGNPRALAYRLGREAALDRLLLTAADTSPLEGWEVPMLPLKGGEIVGRGVAAGPEVARVLRAVEDRWIAEGFPPRDRVEVLLEQELARSSPA
jgi:poly(A) polymerase